MNPSVAMLAATALIGSVAASGCGVGPGPAQEGQADLRVTRAFGATELLDGTLDDPTESDTVVRFLDDEADIETSYGGNFVDSIDGLSGSPTGGAEDWFFFVNGYYSDIGAGEAQVHPGDRIWWDYRRWSAAYRVPAVVGSWPEPFLHGHDGERIGVVVECLAGPPDRSACDDVVSSLDDEGVDAVREDPSEPVAHPDELRILVGPWDRLRADPAAAQIEDGPGTSGVYADLARCDVGYRLEILGSDGEPREQLASGGLVAAVRRGDDQPTWVVTATDETSLDEAAGLLDSGTLRDRYAVASAAGGEPISVPAADEMPRDHEVVCG